MKFVWSVTALTHLNAIYEHIAKDSPRYALRMVDRLTGRSKQIAKFPESGQMVPEYADSSIREVIEGSYRIIYRKNRRESSLFPLFTERKFFLPIVHSGQRVT